MESERIPSPPSDQEGPLRPNNPACIACDILKRRTPAVECMGYANSPCERCRTLIRKCSLTPPRHTTKGSENKDSAERKWKMKGWKTLVSSRSSESGAILKELETTSNSGNKKRDRKKSDGVQDEERERARVKRVKVPGSESGSSKAPKTVMTPRLDSISGIAKNTSTYTSSNPVRRLVLVNPEEARFHQNCNLTMSPSSTVSATITDQERHPDHHSRSSSVSSEERTCRSVLQAKIDRMHSDPLKLKPTHSPTSRMHIPTRTPIVKDGTSNLNHVRTDKDKPSGTQEHRQVSTSKTKNAKTSLPIPSSDDVLSGAQDKSQRKSSRIDASETSQAWNEGKRRRQEDYNMTPSSDSATAAPNSNRSIGLVPSHSAIDIPAQSPRHTRPPKAPSHSMESLAKPDHRTAPGALTAVELNTNRVVASASPAPLLMPVAQGAHAPERQGPPSRYHREEDPGGKSEDNTSMKMRLLQDVLATQMDILETQQAMLALLD